MNTAEKLKTLRVLLADQNLDGFLVPKADEYQNEFVPESAERLAWLTGFTGSAGIAVILQDRAAVLTDNRYTLQVRNEVDAHLYQTADIREMPLEDWLKENAGPGLRIGYDPRLHTVRMMQKLEEAGREIPVEFAAVEENPVDRLWTDRPAPPLGAVSVFPDMIAGRSAADKIFGLAGMLRDKDLYAFVITVADSIAWLLNIRGQDIEYAPLALSKLIVFSDGRVQWFIAPEKLNEGIRSCCQDKVEIRAESELEKALEALGLEAANNKQQIGLDFARSSVWGKNTIERGGGMVQDLKDPCVAPKAIKTAQERAAIRKAHIADGHALCRFFHWLGGQTEPETLDELAVSEKLEGFRRRDPHYRGQSFPTIAGYGPNGAIVHYRASAKTSAPLTPPGLLLIDSGGQYAGGDCYGTTDITRTVAIGAPSEDMKRDFTLVLKGHIAIAQVRFKPGTPGKEIDALGRKALQAEGLDYGHSTGHGVGCYLNVHEEAASLSPRGEDTLLPGMLLSNEPGYYREGAYGIRIENLVLVQGAREEDVLSFETVSFCPIDITLIEGSLLTEAEKAWLNAYHAQIYKLLSPDLEPDVRAWLEAQTAPL